MTHAPDLVRPPVAPRDRLRINKFFPFEAEGRRLLFVVDNAAFAEADDAIWALVEKLNGRDEITKPELLELGKGEAFDEAVMGLMQLEILVPYEFPRLTVDGQALPAEALTSLVLHVSHDCNMRCGYCYADYGRYGGDFGYMDPELAVRHTEKFFDQLGSVDKVHLTFFGGEPLMNMPVVYAAHAYAKERAEKEGRRLSCGLTTNGTLLTPELAQWFKENQFTITVSIDGPPDVNDRLRTLDDGTKSYETIIEGVKTSGVRATARVTLTRKCLEVDRIVRHLVGEGFAEVGVSPVATGQKRFDLAGEDLDIFFKGLENLADDFVAWAKRGELFPFSNIRQVVEQVASGQTRPVPCGAGTRLVAADNKGDLYACHRLVGEEQFKVGHVETGIDGPKRFELLQSMHPRSREPCQKCWARFLCGGGCHHIAWLHSDKQVAPWTISNEFCDFLRRWYRLGLTTYARMAEEAPEMLARLSAKKTSTACNQAQGQ